MNEEKQDDFQQHTRSTYPLSQDKQQASASPKEGFENRTPIR